MTDEKRDTESNDDKDTKKTEEPTSAKKDDKEKKEETPETLSKEDVKKLIEDARKQEKDKLYGRIDELKDTVKTLEQRAQEEQEEKEIAEKDRKEKENKERQESMSETEKLTEHFQKLEEELKQEREARSKIEQQLDADKTKRELDELRAKLIAEAEDEIIPELVRGDSIEEIENNAAVAKARYQELFQEQKEKAEGKKREVGSKMPGSSDPDPASLEEEELKGIIDPDMKLEDYKENRDEILAQVDKAYKQSLRRA